MEKFSKCGCYIKTIRNGKTSNLPNYNKIVLSDNVFTLCHNCSEKLYHFLNDENTKMKNPSYSHNVRKFMSMKGE